MWKIPGTKKYWIIHNIWYGTAVAHHTSFLACSDSKNIKCVFFEKMLQGEIKQNTPNMYHISSNGIFAQNIFYLSS